MSRRILDAAIVLLAAVLLLIIALGGIDYDWGFVPIRLHSWSRPLLLLCVALAARAWISSIDASYIATRGLLAVILSAAAIYATYQVRVCGGLDSYGYVSTSALIASGRLTQPQPLVEYLPFESASSAVAPLGYVAGPDGHTEVPRFSLGLPLVMALFRVFGPMGPFYVPLVMAYVTIALAYLLGASGANGAWGEAAATTTIFALLGAVLVAIDPLMVDSGIQPMSDVPAACWILAAVWLRLERGRVRPLVAGICAGMAFLTRPALLPAAIAIGVVAMDRPLRETVRYAAALLAFVILQMTINAVLYGSAGTSGYGPASYMFEVSTSRLAANVANFGTWLTFSHTFLIWLLWPASLIVLRTRKWAWQISIVAAAAAAPYLFYLVFDDWEAGRFVLPTILLVLILAATALGEMSARLMTRPVGASMVPLTALGVAVACAGASHLFLERQAVYRLRDAEAKFAMAGEWIDTHLPPRAIVFAGLHSGSARYYGHRPTIRWDQIPQDKMSATLHNLEAAGYEPYLALDTGSEPPLFEERFRQDAGVRTEQIGRVRVVNFYRFVSGNHAP